MKKLTEQQLFVQDIVKLIIYIHSKGYNVSFGEAFRTSEQAAIYAEEGKGIKDSLHCKRLAIDLNLFNPAGLYLTENHLYAPFGEYWESLDPINRWGGNFERKDGNHFERNPINWTAL